MAGTGKSTIARTVAANFAGEGRLGASFFFSRGRGDLRNAEKLFPTIAAQLANSLPSLRHAVSEAVARHYSTSLPGLSDQWKYLISEPLSNFKVVSNPPSPIIVIDALDECEGHDDIRLILKLLAKVKDFTSIQLRVFLTSRPEMPTLLGFRNIPRGSHRYVLLHDIPAPLVQHDISIFLSVKLEMIGKEHGLDMPWPRKDETNVLVDRAAGLFIFAATVCRFIGDHNFDPQQQLSLIIQDDRLVSGSTSTVQLDNMYTQVLKHSVLGESDQSSHERLSNRFRLVAGSVITMLDVLSIRDLARLLDISKAEVATTLGHLRSVLNVPEADGLPVRIFHPSFRDFLFDRRRCSQECFWVDEKRTHGDIFRRCLRLMSKNLREDICDVKFPGTSVSSIGKDKINSSIPQAVQYACRYWIDHFRRGARESGDNDLILAFLQQHLLHWLEVLSLLGKMNDAIILLSRLKQEITVRNTTSAVYNDSLYGVLEVRLS